MSGAVFLGGKPTADSLAASAAALGEAFGLLSWPLLTLAHNNPRGLLTELCSRVDAYRASIDRARAELPKHASALNVSAIDALLEEQATRADLLLQDLEKCVAYLKPAEEGGR